MNSNSTCAGVRATYAANLFTAEQRKTFAHLDSNSSIFSRDFAFYYFATKSYFDSHRNGPALLECLGHMRHCTACRLWVRERSGPDVFDRFERAAKYCCIMMFAAVEEPDRAKIKLSFQMYRGEDPTWFIDGTSVFFTYCPWCGTRTPDRPFREEGKENPGSKDV